ncbi:MAG: hypothetical protein ACOZE5_12420 [Verrucomicrobiota bacterium]
MKFPSLLAPVSGAALLGLVVANTVIPYSDPIVDRDLHRFEVRLGSSGPGIAQLFYNTGRGFTERDSAIARVDPGPPRLLVFPLAAESVRDLRFDPINNDATVTVEDALIRRPDGTVLKRFTPGDFSPFNQIERLDRNGRVLTIKPVPGSGDPHVRIALGTENLPLIAVSWPGLVRPFLLRGLPWFGLLVAVWAGWHWLGRRWHAAARSRLLALRGWAESRPKSAVALAAAAAVVLSSYPVIFCGASFVSPNYGSNLLYDAFPTLPGSRATDVVDVRGADIGAIMWQQVPLSAVQSRALFRDFELPLWNRYNSGGTVLLGQGQTMFGDPLHFGVILAGGASWAWDLKYLAAKWLLGLGLGLTVLHAARHLPAALLVAFASVFSGFFVFRVNHPAFFSFCYGPWVLCAWSLVTGAKSPRGVYLSLLGLIAANWFVLTSGTAKEAYVSLFTMNFAGAMWVLCAELPWVERLCRLGGGIAAGLVFMLLSSPIWLTFLDALKAAYSSYNIGVAYQMRPGLLLGYFDELFFRPLREGEQVNNPSGNFVLLLGVLACLVNLRSLHHNPYARGALLGLLLPAAFAFGLVPGSWIIATPFLSNIHHIDNSFGLGFIHLCAVLAGLGFARAAARLGSEEGAGDLFIGLVLLFGLVALYLGTVQIIPGSTYNGSRPAEALHLSGTVRLGLFLQLAACLALMLVARRALTIRRLTLGAALLTAACLTLLLWRHGLHLRTPYPNHTLNAAPRAQFDARSPALLAVVADSREPARIAGFLSHFFPGWHDIYGLEGVSGPDALMNAHMRELQTAFAVGRVWDWRLVLFPDKFSHDRPFYDLMNVRYYLAGTHDPAPAGDGLTLLTRADLAVWRSETAWPRAFFTDRVATYRTAADFAALVRGGDHRPLAAVQDADRGLPALPRGDLADRTIVPATAYRLTTNTTSFTVNAPAAGIIVLGEAWLERDFTATVNGQPAELFRVNHAFKGLHVPRGGTYHVTVRYRPHHFNLALGLSALGLAATAGAGWWIFRRYPAAAVSAHAG